MCVRNLRSLLICIAYRVLFYKGRDRSFRIGRRISKGDTCEEYGSIYRAISRSTDRAQHIPPSAPPTCKESRGCFLGAASALSCSATERSTEEETPIARAVSGSLCVCVRKLRLLLNYGIFCIFIRGATICLHQFVKDGEYRKEIRGIRLNIQGNTQEY